MSEPVNVQAELAKERNRAAAERTLMAWVRTSLALISFGFGIDAIVSAIPRFGVRAVQSHLFTTVLGLAFIALGIYAMIVAALEHRDDLRAVEASGTYVYRSRQSLALRVSFALVAIGLVAFAGVIARQLL